MCFLSRLRHFFNVDVTCQTLACWLAMTSSFEIFCGKINSDGRIHEDSGEFDTSSNVNIVLVSMTLCIREYRMVLGETNRPRIH